VQLHFEALPDPERLQQLLCSPIGSPKPAMLAAAGLAGRRPFDSAQVQSHPSILLEARGVIR